MTGRWKGLDGLTVFEWINTWASPRNPSCTAEKQRNGKQRPLCQAGLLFSVCALQDRSNFLSFFFFYPVDRQYLLQHLFSLHSDSSLGGQGQGCHSFPCGVCLPSTALELVLGVR